MLRSSEADGEVLQTQVVGGAQEAGRVRVRVGRLEGGELRLVTDLLPDLIDVVVLGDSQVQHFFVTVLVERGSAIVEVATEGVAEGEVDVDGAPSDVVDKPASEGGVKGLVIDTTTVGLRALRDDGAVVGLRGFVVLIGVVLYLTRVGVDTSVFSQIVGVVGVTNFVDPSAVYTCGLYAVVAQEGILIVAEGEGRAPRELVRRDVGGAQLDFEARVTHTTYVLQLATEARRT